MVKIRVFFDTSTLTGLKSVGVRAVLSLKSVNMYLGELFHTIAVNGKTVKHWHFWSILYRSSPRCQMYAILELCYQSIMCCWGFMDRGLNTRTKFLTQSSTDSMLKGLFPLYGAPSFSAILQLLVHPMRKHTTINP